MKEITIGGSDRKKFIGHQVLLTGKHPNTGQVGIFTGHEYEDGKAYPIVKLENGETVRVLKSKQWQLA
jgi:hypothetical protein